MHGVEEAAHETGINPDTFDDFYNVCRHTATEFVIKTTRHAIIGGSGKIVCMDEIHKRSRHTTTAVFVVGVLSAIKPS